MTLSNDLKEEEKKSPRVQSMFKQSRHINISIFVINQNYRNGLLELIETSILYSNQTLSGMFKIFIQAKQPWK